MELFKVWGSLMINDSDAIDKLNKADKQSKAAAKEMDKVRDMAGKVGKAMIVGIGAAVTSLTAMAVKSAQATDHIDKMSQKLGLSRKAYQEWNYIMSQNGLTIDSMQSGLNKLNNVVDDVRNGNEKAQQSFEKLGLSMNDIDGKSQEEVFSLVINGLQGMESESERAAIANDLLGRSASELAPLLNSGADSANQLKQRAHELGLVLGDEAIDSGVKFTDTLDDLKRSFGSIVTQIGVEFMPVLQNLADWVLENMPKIREVATNVFNAMGDAVKWVQDNIKWLIPVVSGLIGVFVGLKIVGVISELFKSYTIITKGASGAMAIFNAIMAANPIGLAAIAIGVLIAAIVALVMNFDKVKAAASSLWENIKNVFGNIRDFVTGIFDNFKNIIKLPKFQVSGSLNPITWLKNGLPKLSVKWNADGAIFDSPTIFGTQYGLQGVGEAGPEVVAPISKLQDMIDWNSGIDYDRLGDVVGEKMKKNLVGMRIILDRKEVGEFVDTRIIKGIST